MNTIIRVTLFISIMTSALWADEYISLENNRGNALIAKLILLDEDKLHFERNDGTAFTIEMSTLNQKSQERVLRHFRTTLDTPTEKHLDTFDPLSADQVFYSEDNKHIVRSIYVDKAKDHHPIHPYPEMDITELTLKKLSGNRIEVTIVFLEDLPNAEISDIRARPNSLSFTMKGDSMNRNEVFKLSLTSCTMGGKRVDTIPDRGWLKIDHVNHTR